MPRDWNRSSVDWSAVMPRKLGDVSTEDGVNWRGRIVQFTREGMLRQGQVLTHVRNDVWMIVMDGQRILLPKHEFWEPRKKPEK